MGNRAVIEHLDSAGKADVSIYLHWNGGKDSVSAFLEYAKLQGINKTNEDYQMARLCQIIGNFMDGTYSLGIDKAENWESMSEDNGVFVIDTELNIVERRNNSSYEQEEYDLCEFMCNLDDCQPKHMQIGHDLIKAYITQNKSNLTKAELINSLNVGDIVAVQGLKGLEQFEILGFGDEGLICNGSDRSGKPFFNYTQNYPEDSQFKIDNSNLDKIKHNPNSYLNEYNFEFIVKSTSSLDKSIKPPKPVRAQVTGKNRVENKTNNSTRSEKIQKNTGYKR